MDAGRRAASAVRWIVSVAWAAAAAVLVETGGAIAAVDAATARTALRAGDPGRALEATDRALRLDPWQPHALQTRCAALKSNGLWAELRQAAAHARRWHPDAYWLDLLEGEAAFMSGRSAETAEALWRSFWIRSRPEHSPAQLWRMAMLTGAECWGPNDGRVAAAAIRVGRLIETDPSLSAAERVRLRAEAMRALAEGGAPLTARVLDGNRP